MPDVTRIIAYIMVRRQKGKISHFSPYTAGIIEDVLRDYFEGDDAPDDDAQIPERLPYRIDQWSPDGNKIVDTLAYLDDFAAATAAFDVYRAAKPHDRLTLRHGALVHAEQPWSDQFAPG